MSTPSRKSWSEKTKLLLTMVCLAGSALAGLETGRWQSAIDALGPNGGIVRVPTGRHPVGTLFLRNNVTLELERGCVLEGSADRRDYPDVRIEYAELREPWQGLIVADGCTNVAVVGAGEIFGNGAKFPHGARMGRPQGLLFHRCRDVRVEGVTLRDLARWTCYLKECDGVTFRNVTVDSHANGNNDGIDVDSRNVTIEKCSFDCDDDGIVFKSDNADFLVENVTVRDCRVRSTCSAIKFGTGSHGGFRNVLVENVVCGSSDRAWCDPKTGKGVIAGYRVAKWPGSTWEPSLLSGVAIECVDGGLAENITVRNVEIQAAATPIFIRGGLRYGRTFECDKSLGLPFGRHKVLRHVVIENVRATATSYTASSITGVPGLRLEDIVLKNVRVTVPGAGEAGLVERGRPVPEKAAAYPESNMFDGRMLPAYGFYVRHVDGLRIENVTVDVLTAEKRPELVLDDVTGYSRTLARGAEAPIDEVVRSDAAADAAWDSVADLPALASRRKNLRERLVRAMGGLPEKTPLRARVTGVVLRDGYRVEKVIFESRPGLYVTALAFVPDAASFPAPYPAVLVSCGHANVGKAHPPYQRACVQGAKEGFLMLIVDPLNQGERRSPGEADCWDTHNDVGVPIASAGGSVAAFRTWDGIRALDYLVTRPDVRADALGMMGVSGGGTMTSLVSAVDPRIKAACPACYITSLAELVRCMGVQDAEQFLWGQLREGLNHAAFVLMTEAAVSLQFSKDDFFPIAGSRQTYEVVRRTADRLGIGDRYAATTVPGKHGWKESSVRASLDWMRQWLMGEKRPARTDADYAALDRLPLSEKADFGISLEESRVTPTGNTADLFGSRSPIDLLIDEAIGEETPRLVFRDRTQPLNRFYGDKSAAEESAVLMWMLGRNLVEERVWEIVTRAHAAAKVRSGTRPVLIASGSWLKPAECAYERHPELFSRILPLGDGTFRNVKRAGCCR